MFSFVTETLMLGVLSVYPSASISVAQPELLWETIMGDAFFSPGPNNRTCSGAKEALAINADLSAVVCCTRSWMKWSTYTSADRG